ESLDAGRLRRFRGPTVRLPGCPVSEEGLLFAGPGGRSVVDVHGHRLAALRAPLGTGATVRTIGDGVLVIGTAIYRDGRLIATFPEPGGGVIGASRDGGVVLVAEGTGDGVVLFRDGVAHPLAKALVVRGAVVAPDGSRLLVQHGPQQLIELDTATLRP